MKNKNTEVYKDKDFSIVEAIQKNSFGDCTPIIKFRVYFKNFYLGTTYNFIGKLEKFRNMIENKEVDLKNYTKLSITKEF